MDVTARIAQFVVKTNFSDFPPQALATAKVALRDCLGVALAGSKDEAAEICGKIARQEDAKREASVVGQGFKTSALQAALVNGTSAHALDYDHSFTLMGQPTSPIIPATVALGEALGVSGRSLLEAYVIGFEVTGKLALSLKGAVEDGWHGPTIVGVFGAAAACAKLLQLNAAQVEMALGIAASMAGGVVANFGTMTKPLHSGLAARNGVLAAKLAQGGFTANGKALESEVGFLGMFYARSKADPAVLESLGQSFALATDGIKIKPYACGGLTHVAIDGVLELRAKHSLTADMIDSIEADVLKHVAERIVFKVPQTGVQGKFCMNYLLARAIIDGRIGVEVFTEDAVRDANILKLAERVVMRADPSLKSADPGGRPCRVTIRLKNGQSYSRYAEHAKGSAEMPLSDAELKAKFTECARIALSAAASERALAIIATVEQLGNVSSLAEILRG
jgi:2-methylcitrate dehydratase PrpD